MLTTLEHRRQEGAAAGLLFHDHAPTTEDFRTALTAGLARAEKSIPCRFLYDAKGSQLFEAICRQPEYYPTRTELGLLKARAADIAEIIGPDAELIELGSGASVKVGVLLRAMKRPAAYVPIDISREQLLGAGRRVTAELPGIEVHAVCADYAGAFALPETAGGGRRVAFFPGSTIGNFTPAEARVFLAGWARRVGAGGAMLIGVDLKKDPAILNAAYNDEAGVTAAFSLNLLVRANRELGADFDLKAFRHQALYREDEGRMAIHLRSLVDQQVKIGGERFNLACREAIHIEDSWKYSISEFRALAQDAGFEPGVCWTDPGGLFSLHLLEVAA